MPAWAVVLAIAIASLPLRLRRLTSDVSWRLTRERDFWETNPPGRSAPAIFLASYSLTAMQPGYLKDYRMIAEDAHVGILPA